MMWFFLFLSLFSVAEPGGFPFMYPRVKSQARPYSSDAGNPLIITPYLHKGSISLAQNLSRVSLTNELVGFTSHAGFFTVDKSLNSNLFFWYFPAFSKNPEAPVILWLQGGPGGSSLFGLFTELGPLVVTETGFALRKYHWALNSHLIFVDNPVGTGFSFTDHDQGYCANEDCVAKGLYSAMHQFFTLFPHLVTKDFFIAGESYAGKYIPALGMEIHNRNSNGFQRINLKGLAIGNGYCDPANQIDYGSYLYQHGLIDDNQLEDFEDLQSQIVMAIKKGNWMRADILMNKLIDGDITNYSFFKNYTGFSNYYNFLQANGSEDTSLFTKMLNNDTIRRSVHVGWLPFNSGEQVQMHLASDILKSVAPLVSELLSYYKVLFYNGQLDIIVAYPLTEKFLRNLKFSSADEYKTAERQIWKVGKHIAGYYKKAGNLTEVLVRDAGHMVPHDQPHWAFDLITRFVRNKI